MGILDEFEYNLRRQILTKTAHFWITYDPIDPDAINRAQAVAATCEADLAQLEQFFSAKYVTRYVTFVNIRQNSSGGQGGADNFGFTGDKNPVIDIYGRFQAPVSGSPSFGDPTAPPVPSPDLPFIIQELPRLEFVAEMAELLMDYTGSGFDRGKSHGEALSIVLASRLHPAGYYGANLGPRIRPWLQTARVGDAFDFVNKTEDSDTNIVSYGCGILFLHYLESQLGYGLTQIIAANADTLANVYAKLSGKPAAEGFADFISLLQKHLPAGKAPQAYPATDNIFPLLDQGKRTVWLSTESRTLTSQIDPPDPHTRVQLSVLMRPGFLCPEKRYRYSISREIDRFTAVATCRGLIDAAYRWTLNGIGLDVRQKWTTVSLPVELTTTTPDKKVTAQAHALTIRYLVVDAWNRSAVYVQNVDTIGNGGLEFGVQATEAAMNDGETSAADTTSLVCVTNIMSPSWAADQKRCNPSFEQVGATLADLSRELSYLKNIPDPPRGESLKSIIAAVGRVNVALVAVSKETDQPVNMVLRELDLDSEALTLAAAIPPPVEKIAGKIQ